VTGASLQPKLRRLNRDVIVLGALIVAIALTASIVPRGALAVDLPQWIAIVVGLGLIGAGWFWRDTRWAERYEAWLPWEVLDAEEQPAPARPRNATWLLLACIVTIVWQSTFSVASAQLDQKYRVTQTAGLFNQHLFVYYYYYLDLFPVWAAYVEPVYSKEWAEEIVREQPGSLRMETTYAIQSGDLGKVWLYLPEAFLKSEPREVKVFWLNGWLFMLALVVLLVALWYVDRFALGILLVALLGSHPFQLFEVYADPGSGTGQVFALNISVALWVLAFHVPLLFNRHVHKFYLFALPVFTGLFLATVRQLRTEPVVILVSVLACYALFSRVNWRRRAMLILLVLAPFWIGSAAWQSYFDFKINQAYEFVSRAGGHPFNEVRNRYHSFWHSFWMGLGDFDTTHGYKWDDVTAMDYAYSILKPAGKVDFEMIGTERSTATYDAAGLYFKRIDYLPEYDPVLREKVLHDIRNDPQWYLDILAQRVHRIVNEAAPTRLALGAWYIALPLEGWLLIPMLAFLILARRWSLLKLLCFTLPLAATAFVIYSGGGYTYYSVFLQVVVAIGSALIWSSARRALRR